MTLHSLGQDHQDAVQYDIFGHVMSLASAVASFDANSIIKGTTEFLRSW